MRVGVYVVRCVGGRVGEWVCLHVCGWCASVRVCGYAKKVTVTVCVGACVRVCGFARVHGTYLLTIYLVHDKWYTLPYFLGGVSHSLSIHE